MKQDEHAAGFEFVIPETAATSVTFQVLIIYMICNDFYIFRLSFRWELLRMILC